MAKQPAVPSVLAPRRLTHRRRPQPGHHRIAAVPFTLRNLRADLEDVGSNFDGSPDLEFRLATDALALEQSGLSYQRVPPTTRWSASVAGRGSPGCRKSRNARASGTRCS